MLKKISFVVLLLSPSVLLAAEPECLFSSLKRSAKKCYAIGTDQAKCLKARRCFWDEEDGRCEPLKDRHGCGRITSPQECNSSSKGCFWDEKDGRCERLSSGR